MGDFKSETKDGEIGVVQPKWVLVVENEVAVRDRLLEILESNGYRATGVGSIVETLALPNLHDVKANLPDGTAEELLLKQQARVPEAASVVVIGDAHMSASLAALRHGAIDYLAKPINANCLQACAAKTENMRECNRWFAQFERLARIGQSVTSVAHDSRNALQRIQARVELMELVAASDAEKLEDLRVIKSATDSLRCMFEELREFAAPIVLEKERCLLRELVGRAWQSLEGLRATRAASLECNLDDTEVVVDPMRFERVFRNLFENALTACTSPARIEVSWSMAHHANQSTLRILIRDNGPGFSEEQREKAFEPFFTTKSKGTGLGLPICSRILEQHQGWMEIRPDTEIGACIMLVLPLEIEAAKSKCHGMVFAN